MVISGMALVRRFVWFTAFVVLSVFCTVLWRETLSPFVLCVCVYLVCLGSIRAVFVYGIYPVG